MDPHDYAVEHFRMMAEIAGRLKSAPALVLEHRYTCEGFGSWWFTFKRSGKKFRVVFDGRDRSLSLEREVAGRLRPCRRHVTRECAPCRPGRR